MILSKEQINIIEEKTASSDDYMCSTISTSKKLVDIFTRKKAKTMHSNEGTILKSDNEWGHMTLLSDNLGKLKPTELILPTSQQEYNDKEKLLEEK